MLRREGDVLALRVRYQVPVLVRQVAVRGYVVAV